GRRARGGPEHTIGTRRWVGRRPRHPRPRVRRPRGGRGLRPWEAMTSTRVAQRPRPGDEELLHAYAGYLEAQRGMSAHTVRAYLGDATQLLRSLPVRAGAAVETSDLDRLDLTTLRAWLADQARRGLSRSTLARRSASARTFTAWAHRTGRLPTDPGLRLLAPRPDTVVPATLAVDEAAAVLDVARTRADDGDPAHLRDWAALELLYASGVRVSELVGVDVDDLDLDQRLVRVLGKGGKERMVPFGVPAARALREWLAARPRLVGPTSPHALFLGARGGR